MHNIKLNQIATIAQNSRNNQNYLILKKKQLKKFGLEPKDLLNMQVPKSMMLPQRKQLVSPQLKRLQLRANQLKKEAFR